MALSDLDVMALPFDEAGVSDKSGPTRCVTTSTDEGEERVTDRESPLAAPVTALIATVSDLVDAVLPAGSSQVLNVQPGAGSCCAVPPNLLQDEDRDTQRESPLSAQVTALFATVGDIADSFVPSTASQAGARPAGPSSFPPVEGQGTGRESPLAAPVTAFMSRVGDLVDAVLPENSSEVINVHNVSHSALIDVHDSPHWDYPDSPRPRSEAEEVPSDLELEAPQRTAPAVVSDEGAVEHHHTVVDPAGGLHVYEVSADAPSPWSCHTAAPSLRRARRMAVNAAAGAPFANDNFEGEILMWHRPSCEAEDGPQQHYFAGKSRQWELRVQGRFKRPLSGTLWGGVVLQDCDYRIPPSATASLLAQLTFPVFKAALGQSVYFSWGDREEAAEGWEAEPELAHVVSRVPGFDQLIRTPAGEKPPPLNGDLSSYGVRRNDMGSAAYCAKAQEFFETIGADLQDTYTFCFWGASRFYNALEGRVSGLIPFSSIDINGFMDGYPLHLALYDLADASGHEQDADKHLESRKRYIFDLMLWSSQMSCPLLKERYSFTDASGGHIGMETGTEPLAAKAVLRASPACPPEQSLFRRLGRVVHGICSGCAAFVRLR